MKFKLDDVDHKILDLLIDNSRIPFTDIAKKLLISAGTVHVRVKKMEEFGIIQGASLALDYKKLGYTFIASLLVWFLIKVLFGIRLSDEEQAMGADSAEIGITAYPEFSK